MKLKRRKILMKESQHSEHKIYLFQFFLKPLKLKYDPTHIN